MFINWSKTKVMFLTRGRIEKPKSTILMPETIEVVSEFKLLGVMLDESLTFTSFFSLMRKTVLNKLFSIKQIFFLPYSVKVQFFKTFILPHFDYCNSLIVYFSNSILSQTENLFNFVILKLFNIKLNDLSLDQQRDALSKYNILPYRYRSLLRLCIFFHKILNNQILNIFFNSLKKPKYNFRNNNLFVEPSSKTYFGFKRLSVFFRYL